jgi:hypothetical protein
MPEIHTTDAINFDADDLDSLVLDLVKEGKYIRAIDFREEEKEGIHIKIEHMRHLLNDIYALYKGGEKPTKEEILSLFKKNEKKMQDAAFDLIEGLDNDKFFKVTKRAEDKDGNITIKLTKINMEEKNALIRRVADKLMRKMTPEQVRTMLEEGLRKMNDASQLAAAEKALKKKKPEIEGHKGCYKLVIEGIDLHVMP